mgnify:CR=1 FL=1
MHLFRLARIVSVFHRYGLDEFVLRDTPNPILRGLGKLLRARSHDRPRGERLRAALAGQSIVAGGQVLMTNFQHYLRADQRACVAAIENLWRKYAVTAKQIEAQRDTAAVALQKFLVELGYVA